MSQKVAVIDIGSARTKVFMLENIQGVHHKKKRKYDTKLFSSGPNTSKIHQVLHNTLTDCINQFKELGINEYIIVATETLRKEQEGLNEVIQELSERFGTINLISSELEGKLFFESLTTKYGEDEYCLVDIGGGSVQIISKNTKGLQVVSLKSGTYALEKKFQNEFPPSEEELSKMEQFITSEISKSVSSNTNHNTIVFGSNCMEDFITEVSQSLGKTYKVSDLNIQSIKDLLNAIKTKPFEEVKLLYPSNPFFMYGADKALINLITIAKYFNTQSLTPTNSSVSEGLAMIVMHNKSMLSEYQLAISNLL